MVAKRRVYKRRVLVLIVSCIALISDVAFVGLNYWSAKSSLENSLMRHADNHMQSINIAVNMTYRNMLQFAKHLTHHQELNQLFLEGKQAVESKGSDSPEANKIRQKMLTILKLGWDEMTAEFDVRQLHYHLAPGSLSFLRVHRPEKFGDRMDEVRHTVVDTNTEKKQHIGFETGRVYSGLRGVVPVFATDRKTNKTIHVGAVEVGTSYQSLLEMIAAEEKIGAAVLLTQAHVAKNMWPEYVESHFGKALATCSCFIEASSGSIEETKGIVLALEGSHFNNPEKTIKIIKENGRYLKIYHAPLQDYQSLKNKSGAVGYTIIWDDVTKEINKFYHDIQWNIMYGIIGFLGIELALFFGIRLEDKYKGMKELMILDGLTGIPNRRDFEITLVKEINRCKRSSIPLSVVMSDIDYFKPFNDTYGHVKGDECLRNVATALSKSLNRSSDYVARYGGEEFVLILPNTTEKQAVAIAEKARIAVEELAISHKGSKVSSRVTMSFGVASTDFKDQKQMTENLIILADNCLYDAKEQGRNCVVVRPT